MKKSTFELKEIILTGEYGVSAIRTRTSSQHASITIKVATETGVKSETTGGSKTQIQPITFDASKGESKTQIQSITFDVLKQGDAYEMVAREVVSVLDEICAEICPLPKEQ